MFIYIAGLIYYKWLFLAIIKTGNKEYFLHQLF